MSLGQELKQRIIHTKALLAHLELDKAGSVIAGNYVTTEQRGVKTINNGEKLSSRVTGSEAVRQDTNTNQ